jgi:hypothetical protein
MSIDSRASRPTAPDASAPAASAVNAKLAARALVAPREASVLDRVSDAADTVLAPLDHFKDTLAGDLTLASRAVEARTRRIPVLAQLAQFGSGALAAGWSMVEGTYSAMRHPVQTVQGLWTMASHVPVVSPMWWVNGVKDGFGKTLSGDKVFWKAVGQGVIAPYAKDWGEGRYFAVAGRAAVDVGTLVVGVKNAKAAFEGWKARRASAAVDDVAKLRPDSLDDGLRSAVLSDEPRIVGEVVPEGVTVVKPRPDVTPAQAMLRRRKQPLQANSRKPRVRFKGNLDELDAGQMTRVKLDQDAFRRLRQVGPRRMQKDAAVRDTFRKLTRSVDTRMDNQLNDILGVKPQGKPKVIDRAAAKLETWQAQSGPKVRLDDLDDLARGRIDLPAFNPKEMKGMLERIRTHFGDQNLLVNDYVTKGKPFYRGRLHIKIKDRSGLWYELQIGPKQLSEFYDTPFLLGRKGTNIHDAVYKGVLMLDDEAVALLGKGDKLAGQARLARVLDDYVSNMNDVMRLARKGEPLDYAAKTAKLRQGLVDLFDEVPDELMPLGLR